ncbi:hypothetical protein ACFPZL_11715 [Leucobacter soli]|uniref:Uncharacterized protein n=1 Tax=Leucobacter soli TaxID=2812850 RepID=A0A916JVA8_9MICO|nr:hypothetical protein [Leucobacter soli]CAG7605699.1 hypothetical protein LEUCIP111803_00858 [Leucobacter soli]
MIITEFPRDLLMTGVIFGVAAFVWSGWAQERPPTHWIWRIVLALLGLGGLALTGISMPAVIRNWTGPTAISFGGTASTIYLTVFALEVVAIVVVAIWATRRRRGDLIAPLVLAVVGIHFIPLAPVFGQPIFAVTGILVTIVAVVAALLPLGIAARSFWCGILGAPVLLVVGAICTVSAFGSLSG